MPRSYLLAPNRQRGAAAVEFAIVASVLFTALLAVFEFGRILLVWNEAVEATTQGARVAAVCPVGSTAPARRMNLLLPGVSDAVEIEYLGWTTTGTPIIGCQGTQASPCMMVRASLKSNAFFQRFSTPLLYQLVPVPQFTTAIPSESVSSVARADPNPMCSL